jgi:hypothetical protein
MIAGMAEPVWQALLQSYRAVLDAAKWLAILVPWPRMTTAEAVQYIAYESNWSHQRREQGTEETAVIFAAFDELERGLREWRWLNAEGFMPGASIADKLPPDYWREVQLDRIDHLRPDHTSRSRTEQLPPGRRNPVENVTVSTRAVQLRWPRPLRPWSQ